jgi:hypothetical protein
LDRYYRPPDEGSSMPQGSLHLSDQTQELLSENEPVDPTDDGLLVTTNPALKDLGHRFFIDGFLAAQHFSMGQSPENTAWTVVKNLFDKEMGRFVLSAVR